MKIIYNPEEGAPITTFIYEGVLLDPHFPDGFELPTGELSNGLMQYEDRTADLLAETYEFLQIMTLDKAQEILDRPKEPKYKCDYAECEFSTHTKIALMGHSRKHKRSIEDASKPVIGGNVIPISGGRRIPTLAEKGKIGDNDDVINGTDKDGVDWYGSGLEVENKSATAFSQVRSSGKGHFNG
jgi:hypothetical protein